MLLPRSEAADDRDQALFCFEGESSAKDWMPAKLPEIDKEQPPPTIEIVAMPWSKSGDTPVSKCLKHGTHPPR